METAILKQRIVDACQGVLAPHFKSDLTPEDTKKILAHLADVTIGTVARHSADLAVNALMNQFERILK